MSATANWTCALDAVDGRDAAGANGAIAGRWRRSFSGWALGLLAATLAVTAPGAGAVEIDSSAPANAIPAEPEEPVALSVVLNGTQVADGQVLWRDTARGAARFWVPDTVARRWRLNAAQRAHRSFENQSHAAFCEGADRGDGGERCEYDEAAARLMISVNNTDLLPLLDPHTPVKFAAAAPVQSLGGVLNYDFTAWHAQRLGLAGFLEGRVHSPWGHGALRLAAAGSAAGKPLMVLAQGLWQVDIPGRGWSVQGGSIQVPDTVFGAGLALTGLRVGSNPRLSPTVSNRLQPVVEGVAERALRADVFIDGLFRRTVEVPYGPYRIELAPPLAGRSDIELVTTDLTGNQQRQMMPFYASPLALAEGATEWSIDVGRPSRGNGLRSSGQPFLATGLAAGSWRLGLADGWTVQAQVLGGRGLARAALAGDRVDARWGVSSLSLVAQRDRASDPAAPARLWLGFGHEYQARNFAASVRGEHRLGRCDGPVRSGSFVDTLNRPCNRFAATLSLPLAPTWSVAAALASQRESDGRKAAAAALNLRWAAGPRSELTLSMQRLSGAGGRAASINVTWSHSFGGYGTQVGASARKGGRSELAWAAQSLPAAEGASAESRWQAGGTLGPRRELGARWTERLAHAEWRAEGHVSQNVSHGVSHSASRASIGLSGALGLAEGRLFASRRIDDAFVIVDVGLPGLPVLLDNREVARTNAAGWAVVTEARALQPNRIGVDIAALPVQYALPRDQETVVPALGAGSRVVFELSDGGLSLPVRDDAGHGLPAGASVSVSNQRVGTAVTSRSEVFVERSDRPAQIVISWSGQRCGFGFDPAAAPQDRVYRCEPLP